MENEYFKRENWNSEEGMSEIYSSAGNERSENAYCKQNESTLEEFRGRRSRRVKKKE